jgi:hypothetical protein
VLEFALSLSMVGLGGRRDIELDIEITNSLLQAVITILKRSNLGILGLDGSIPGLDGFVLGVDGDGVLLLQFGDSDGMLVTERFDHALVLLLQSREPNLKGVLELATVLVLTGEFIRVRTLECLYLRVVDILLLSTLRNGIPRLYTFDGPERWKWLPRRRRL